MARSIAGIQESARFEQAPEWSTTDRINAAAMNPDKPIIQIFPKEKFTKRFVDFTNEAFPDSNIIFLIYGSDEKEGYVRPSCDNAMFFEDPRIMLQSSIVKTQLESSAMIVVNWCVSGIALRLWRYRSKMLLMFWGRDLYRLRDVRFLPNPKSWLADRLFIRLMGEVKGILTLIPGDLGIVREICPNHAEWHLACVMGPLREPTQASGEIALPPALISEPGTLRVLVGNSATVTNRHVPMLRKLAQYKDERMMVYAPLSYGNDAYRNEVVREGERLLGDKFVPLTEFLDRESYLSFLDTIHVGVFNHNRQQGMGNIIGLMMRGKKVFMASDSPMWSDFKEQGCIMFDSSTVGEMSFEEFAAMCDEARCANVELLDWVAMHERGVALWRDIYALADGE